jgi:hypothetical protein
MKTTFKVRFSKFTSNVFCLPFPAKLYSPRMLFFANAVDPSASATTVTSVDLFRAQNGH